MHAPLTNAMPNVRTPELWTTALIFAEPQKEWEVTRVPVCCWSPCSGAQIPASCVLACYWSMAVCYWGSSQSQTTIQLAGIWAPLHGDLQHTGTLVEVRRMENYHQTEEDDQCKILIPSRSRDGWFVRWSHVRRPAIICQSSSYTLSHYTEYTLHPALVQHAHWRICVYLPGARGLSLSQFFSEFDFALFLLNLTPLIIPNTATTWPYKSQHVRQHCNQRINHEKSVLNSPWFSIIHHSCDAHDTV